MSVFAFDDSGAPTDAILYTTLVILHGCAFSKDIFRKLLPLAGHHYLRIVLLNRRGYPGSKPLTEEELRLIDGPEEQGHEQYFGAQAQELADFLVDFAVKQHLPTASGDSGGIALMGWSAGNACTLSLLSQPQAIDESTRKALEPFLRTMVIFDAPAYIAGRSLARSGVFIFSNATYTDEERFRKFADYAGAYFEHPSVASHNIKDLQIVLDSKQLKTSTTSRFTSDEYRKLVWPEAAMKVDVPAMTYPVQEFERWMKRALFEDDLAQEFWPSLKVEIIWCEHSTAPCVEAGWIFEELRKEYDDKGVVGRPMRITMMPGANHFPHWDQPEKTIALFANVIAGVRGS
ncbi:hypothetical protein SCHPADRAFT_890150 [Schizopora paradoxa]|uniref:AB hydrolase-1 domain-containing protein n=1 Tax=Schizopora paradoxa TaxID=27342 RepID=A0A0H2RNS8_9AGAM|nr:hypothetical protein SCHPADRAFT_890150 [Schizopora paradoxa]